MALDLIMAVAPNCLAIDQWIASPPLGPRIDSFEANSRARACQMGVKTDGERTWISPLVR